MPQNNGKALRLAISPQQQRFCEEYVDLGNITNAAKAAGYSPKSAHVQGTRLLKNDKVAAYVDYLREQAESAATLTRTRAREILSEIAEGRIIETKVSDRIRAIAQDAMMAGYNAPTKVEGDFSIRDILEKLPRTTGLPNDQDDES